MNDVMPFEQEQKYYDEHKVRLLQHHEGKCALIVGDELVGAFDRQEDAYRAGVERFGNVPMFIRLVQHDDPPVSMPALTLDLISARTCIAGIRQAHRQGFIGEAPHEA